MSPLVSVIIPTYNRAEYVSAAIDSVLGQSYQNLELIVVDDGSTDDTPATLSCYHDRIRVIRQPNAGPAAARNRGIAASQGSLIAFQDSDDLWRPTKLERQVALLERAGASVPCCLCNVAFGPGPGARTTFDFSGIQTSYEESLWLNVAQVLATRFVLFNQAVVIRREAIERVGVFDQSLKYLEDYDLPLRLALEGPWAIIREPLVIYREGAVNSFSQQALRDPVVLKDCELTIFLRILEQVRRRGDDPALQKLVEYRVRMLRRGRRAAGLQKSSSARDRIWGRALMTLDHYYFAAFRRSRWFPRAVTGAVSERAKLLSQPEKLTPALP